MKRKLYTSFIFILLIAGTVVSGPGDLDTTFAGTGKLRFGFNKGDDTAKGTAIQADGKIVVVGSTTNGFDTDYLVIRYNVDGTLDGSFGAGGRVLTSISAGNDAATSVAIQPDGKIVVAGSSQGNGTGEDFSVVRYLPDGSLDPTFGLGGKQITQISNWSDVANALAIQPDGKIVLAGVSGTQQFHGNTTLVRYTASGSIDFGFGGLGTGKKITDASMGNWDDYATGIAVLPDGKLFVVGQGVGINYFLRYLSDGSSDSTWGLLGNGILNQQYGNVDGLNAVTVQPDGKILIAGVSDGKFMVIRFNNTQNASYDTTFNSNGRLFFTMGTGQAEAKAIMVTGTFIQKIVVAGHAANGSHKDFAIARLDLTGAFDSAFNGNGRLMLPIGQGDDEINAIAAQGGSVVAAGVASNGSNHDFALARVTTAGAPDTSFDLDGKRTDDVGYREAFAASVAARPDGKVVVGGYTQTDHDLRDFAVARYNADGSPDTFFDGDGKATIDFGGSDDNGTSVAVQADGKVVVAGSRYDPSALTWDFAVARFNVDGSPDLSFNGSGRVISPIGPSDDEASAVAVQPDGKILLAGTVKVSDTNTDFAVARFNTNGSPDNSFGTGGRFVFPMGIGNDVAVAMRLQADGKIVVGGNASNGTNMDFAVARITTGGALDNTFGSFGRQVTPIGTGEDQAFSVAIQPDGKILVGGYKLNGTTSGDQVVVRYTSAGQPDPSFDNDGIAMTRIGLLVSVSSGMEVQPDGKIVAGGVAAIGQQLDFSAARFNTNGSLDESYGIGGKAIASITDVDDFGLALTLDASGRAIIAGHAKGLAGIVRLQGDIAPRKTPFDFDGDGKTDLSIFRPGSGQWWIQKSADGGSSVAQFGAGTDKLAPVDFTGDGKSDVAFFRPSDGHWYVLRSENSSFYAFPFGTNGDIPVPADYDGDGKGDAAVFRPSNSTWYIQRSSDFGVTITQFGVAGDQPVVADYDGDGKADIAIRRPANGQWWLSRSTAGVMAVTFGAGTDNTVQGDYTGDGKADVAVWRPSSGAWFVLRSEDLSFYAFPFGTTGDVPSPGDYDGDGKTDATVFRPNGSTWYVNKTSGGVLITQFGAAGDQPVPNAFVR
jgi:uncharacterized delta-60 repeat protein